MPVQWCHLVVRYSIYKNPFKLASMACAGPQLNSHLGHMAKFSTQGQIQDFGKQEGSPANCYKVLKCNVVAPTLATFLLLLFFNEVWGSPKRTPPPPPASAPAAVFTSVSNHQVKTVMKAQRHTDVSHTCTFFDRAVRYR